MGRARVVLRVRRGAVPRDAVRRGTRWLIVATGVASAHGRVGWVGTIFVAEPERGRGLGGAITAAVIESLDRAGCATLALVATDLGRPVYERLGFETRTFYQTYELEGRSPAGPPGKAEVRPEESGTDDPAWPGGIRPFGPADVAEAAALDAVATGEDRRTVLAAMTAVDGGLSLRLADGSMAGFVLRAPWGGGATVARSADAAIHLLDARLSGPARTTLSVPACRSRTTPAAPRSRQPAGGPPGRRAVWSVARAWSGARSGARAGYGASSAWQSAKGDPQGASARVPGPSSRRTPRAAGGATGPGSRVALGRVGPQTPQAGGSPASNRRNPSSSSTGTPRS